MELQQQPPRQPEGCLTVAIRLPVRIVVLVLVVPVRLLWDAVAATGRAVYRTVLRPVGRGLGWLARTLIVLPLTYTAQGLAWAVRVLVFTPLGWLWRWLAVPLWRYAVALPASCLYRYVLTPLGHGIAWLAGGGWAALAWLGRGIGAVLSALATALVRVGLFLFVIPVGWFCRRVLMPVGRALAVVAREVGAALGHAWRIAGHLSRAVGRALAVVAREIGAAFGHAWRIAGHLSRAVGRALKWLGWQLIGRPVRWVWRTLCAPVLHWARRTLWAPAARAAAVAGRAARAALSGAARTAREALSSVRATVRQARADAWRALAGGPRREPEPLAARTLGSTTTASGAVPAPEISLSKTEG
ncbi:hypothetical protein [Streptomyces sp. YS-3]|uniref:hypothetical protein n=1 Tax=Streptomyces sp. YS-3 TaxID=3381352 RepID=UPI00386282CA